MAKGFGFVREQKSERAARSGGASVFAGKLLFKLGDGDVENVRFVADEDGEYLYGVVCHEVPVEGRAWGDNVPCIAQDEDGNRTDDDCPGCEKDLKFKDRYFVHVLWKEAPIYKKDEKGKLVKDNTNDYVVLGHEDQMAIWPMGPQLAENLDEIHESYDLGSREFKIKRKGEKLDTEYTILPAVIDGGPSKPTKSEKKLIATSDIDPADFVKPPSYEDFERRLNGGFKGKNDDDDSGSKKGNSRVAKKSRKSNPFKRAEDE